MNYCHHKFSNEMKILQPSVLYPMLYKICSMFGIIPRYENDERILKLWLKLAERFPQRGLAVMDFAHTKGSCRQLANFYVRWSEMYEMSGIYYLIDV